jgi:hypothetical protein
MSELQIQVWRFSTALQGACVLCGTVHDQGYAAAVLFAGIHQLGALCPRCLSAGPERAAERARQRAGRMRQAGERLRAQADGLENLARRLVEMGTWPVTVAEVQKAERDAMRSHFPALREEDMVRMVEDRYRDLREEPA